MNKFFPSWQKSVGTVTMVVLGVVAYAAINKWFRIEQKLPNPNMKKAA